MEQVRMPISELETFLAEKLSFNITRTHLLLTMSNKWVLLINLNILYYSNRLS